MNDCIKQLTLHFMDGYESWENRGEHSASNITSTEAIDEARSKIATATPILFITEQTRTCKDRA